MQHANGRTGDCPGPRKGTTTRRNVTQGGCLGPWPAPADPPPPPHIRKIFLGQKMKFLKGARNLRPILGTQKLFWPLTPPPAPPLSNGLSWHRSTWGWGGSAGRRTQSPPPPGEASGQQFVFWGGYRALSEDSDPPPPLLNCFRAVSKSLLLLRLSEDCEGFGVLTVCESCGAVWRCVSGLAWAAVRPVTCSQTWAIVDRNPLVSGKTATLYLPDWSAFVCNCLNGDEAAIRAAFTVYVNVLKVKFPALMEKVLCCSCARARACACVTGAVCLRAPGACFRWLPLERDGWAHRLERQRGVMCYARVKKDERDFISECHASHSLDTRKKDTRNICQFFFLGV